MSKMFSKMDWGSKLLTEKGLSVSDYALNEGKGSDEYQDARKKRKRAALTSDSDQQRIDATTAKARTVLG